MDIDELMVVVEQNRFGLSKLDDEFYDRIRKKIEELEEAKNSGDEATRVRCEDEIKSIRRLARKIFEMRTGRIINAAWAEVCGQPVGGDLENMTSVERDFFRKLIEFIGDFKKLVLEGRRGEEYELVRVKKDVEIQGADGRTYKLKREDVVTLPKLNAETLLKGGFVEKINVERA
ncbi:MAG: hypothetical protein ABWW66_06355 [Archaeoglobaceae archaeon]